MRRFEATAHEISSATEEPGGPGDGDRAHRHPHRAHHTRAQSSELAQQRWSARETRHQPGGTQPAATMSLAAIDSLRALRSYSPVAFMSFISTSAASVVTSTPAVPSASSSLLPVQQSATVRRSQAAQGERHGEDHDHGYRVLASGARVPVRPHTEQRPQQPRHFASISSSDSFVRPIRITVRRDEREGVSTRNGFPLTPRSHEFTWRARDYETDSDDSSSAPREHDYDYARASATRATNSRQSAPAPQSSRHAKPAPRLPPASAMLLPLPPPQQPASTPGEPPPAPTAARQSPSSPSPRRKTTRGRRKGLTPEEKRKARTCVVDGCNNYIVHRHRCFRHGGGKRCSIDGCNTSAKQRGLCWRHGGSIICKIEGCTRGVKSKGVCWTHGEGKKKQDDEDDDANSSSSQTVYYCIFDDCYKAPVVNSFCAAHSQEVTQPGYVYEL